jgi:hypothetical protein
MNAILFYDRGHIKALKIVEMTTFPGKVLSIRKYMQLWECFVLLIQQVLIRRAKTGGRNIIEL